MSVKYLPIDEEHVSAEWHVVLEAMRHAGVTYRVNEGHRTMARQQYFYDLYRSGRGNLAAVPSANAPHIRTGRIDHAIDFGNDGPVYAWLEQMGLHPVRTVRGESWHIEVAASALQAFAKAHGDPLHGLAKSEKAMASRLLHHRRGMAAEGKTGHGPKYRTQLKWARFWKARVEKQMKRLQRDARKKGGGGWSKANRGGRYQVLGRVLKATDGRL